MNTVISKLLVYMFNGYNKDIYYEMSLYILSHISLIKDMSLSDFAQKCHTSTTTVKKFCKIIGYKDFNVMKQYLFSTIEIRKKQIMERYHHYDINRKFDEIDLITHTSIDRNKWKESIEIIVDSIHKAQELFIVGANYPVFLSFNLIEDMIVFGKNCYIQNVDQQVQDYYSNEDAYGLLITITGRSYMLNQNNAHMLSDAKAQFGIISQNLVIKDKIRNVNTFIQLPGKDDDESLNMVIMNIMMMIKFRYFEKYILV